MEAHPFGVFLMIREANSNDLSRILEMGKKFISTTSYNKHLNQNYEKMAELIKGLISIKGILVSDSGDGVNGMLGYVLHSHFISGETSAGEVFWWMEPDSRGSGVRLLRETEKRSKEAGAKTIQMIAPNDKVAHFYQRIGYEFVEATYQKKL